MKSKRVQCWLHGKDVDRFEQKAREIEKNLKGRKSEAAIVRKLITGKE